MSERRPWAIEWRQGDDLLVAMEPTPAEVARAAPALAAFYNDDHNRRMMAHEETLHAEDVVDYYTELGDEGGRPFLLQLDGPSGPLMGDADLRNIEGPTGEFAIMIGARAAQGRGLGTRYAIMVHAFAFRVLGLARVYMSVIPANAASQRLFGKLGYEPDDSPEARDFADDDSDLTMSIARDRFESLWARELGEIKTHERLTGP
jgi:RimJ/RimL family protein N-acetyltransferase